MKKTTIYYIVITVSIIILFISGCNSMEKKSCCDIVYENKRPKLVFGTDPLNGISLENYLKRISEFDSLRLRFRDQFYGDTVYIYKRNKLVVKEIITTDLSLAFAKSINLSKSFFSDDPIILRINNSCECVIEIKRDYIYIDIYYNKENKKLELHFNNDFLVLS